MSAILFSFTQGVLAFFAPCAVALLPGYITSFISRHQEEHENKVYRIFMLTSLIILGILAVYAVAGVLIILASQLIKEYLKYVAVGMGVVVIILGALMALGKSISISLHLKHRKYSSEVVEAFLFGIAYAIGALGCLFPLFLVVVTQALAAPTIVERVAHIAAYFVGICLFMVLTIVLSVVSKSFIQNTLRSVLPYIERVSGVVLIVAGVYIIYYQSVLF